MLRRWFVLLGVATPLMLTGSNASAQSRPPAGWRKVCAPHPFYTNLSAGAMMRDARLWADYHRAKAMNGDPSKPGTTKRQLERNADKLRKADEDNHFPYATFAHRIYLRHFSSSYRSQLSASIKRCGRTTHGDCQSYYTRIATAWQLYDGNLYRAKREKRNKCREFSAQNKALKTLDDADDALAKGRLAEARRLYRRALGNSATRQRARAGLQEVARREQRLAEAKQAQREKKRRLAEAKRERERREREVRAKIAAMRAKRKEEERRRKLDRMRYGRGRSSSSSGSSYGGTREQRRAAQTRRIYNYYRRDTANKLARLERGRRALSEMIARDIRNGGGKGFNLTVGGMAAIGVGCLLLCPGPILYVRDENPAAFAVGYGMLASTMGLAGTLLGFAHFAGRPLPLEPTRSELVFGYGNNGIPTRSVFFRFSAGYGRGSIPASSFSHPASGDLLTHSLAGEVGLGWRFLRATVRGQYLIGGDGTDVFTDAENRKWDGGGMRFQLGAGVQWGSGLFSPWAEARWTATTNWTDGNAGASTIDGIHVGDARAESRWVWVIGNTFDFSSFARRRHRKRDISLFGLHDTSWFIDVSYSFEAIWGRRLELMWGVQFQ